MAVSDTRNFAFQRNVAIVGVVLFLAKLYGWYLTGSDAVFSDAMESTVNIIAAFMGLFSLYLAAKPKDKEHPYGHGKVEFVTAGIEGALIIIAGMLIITEASGSLLHGKVLKRLDYGIFIVAVTAAVNFFMGALSIRRGKQLNSQVLISSGKHLQSDTITTIGLVVGLLIVYLTKIVWLDAAIAIIFGLYIIYIGYTIIREALGGIMDEADPQILGDLAAVLQQNRQPQWIDVHNTRIQQHGSKLHLDAHITLPYYLELRSAHQEMENVVLMVAEKLPRQIEFNFHIDDCKPFSCKICTLSDCPVRQYPTEKIIQWTALSIAQEDKHSAE